MGQHALHDVVVGEHYDTRLSGERQLTDPRLSAHEDTLADAGMMPLEVDDIIGEEEAIGFGLPAP